MRSCNILQQAFGSNHPEVATSLYDLAELYLMQSNYAKAEPLYQQALRIRQYVLLPNHPDIATLLEGYSNLLERMNRTSEAKQYIKSAQTIREFLRRENSPLDELISGEAGGE